LQVKTKLIAIGNSRGVRIPAPLIKEAGLAEEVEITVAEGGLYLRAVTPHPRAGWAAEIAMATEEDLALMVDDFVTNEFDEHEWQWK
jgi:antitoxin MazE